MGKLKKMYRYLSVLLVVAMLDLSMVAPAYAAEATPTLEVTPVAEATPAAEVTEAAVEQKALDPNGTYHAALGIQTCDMLWIGRWGYYDVAINPVFGTDKNAVLFSGAEKTNNYVEYAGTFSDVTIEGNGTYTASLTGADFAGEVNVSQLFVATDIPVSDEITFSNVSAKINGKTWISFDEAYLENEAKYTTGGMVILAINHWRAPLEKYLVDNGLYVDGNGLECLKGTGSDTIEITFTVSGFAYDKAVEATPTPASVAPTAAPAKNDNTTETSATTDGNADKSAGSLTTVLIIIGAVLIVSGIAVVIVSRKKKHN